MSKITLTPDQQKAVFARNSSILVSAAAGSGKTRVLTERLMSYVCDEANPRDISSFLIITYTRAAAAELRSRILDELSARSAAEPENRRLRRQTNLAYRAQIGTIHSFCTLLLREYAHKVGLSPDFRVADEDTCAALREKALEKTLEQAYAELDKNPGFMALVEGVGAGRDDSRLVKTLLDLSEKMQSHPYPEKWAGAQLAALDVSALTDAGESPWGQELLQNATATVAYWQTRLSTLWAELQDQPDENEPLLNAYGPSFSETLNGLETLQSALKTGWDAAFHAFPVPFPRLKPLRNFEYEERKIALTAARDGCKKAMEGLAVLFDAPSEKLLSDLQKTAPAMAALLRLTLDYSEHYAAEKRRRGLLDFSDLEHFTVRLLADEETDAPTETALEISRRYTEIMVDEYQDVNAVQELIFRCVSKSEENIFMVGDVKQSIYRFRLADPGIFLKKYREYPEYVSSEDNISKKILLRSNFRSDSNILAACNHVFTNTMSEALGELSYDKDAALVPPETAPPPRGQVLFSVLELPAPEEGEERPDKAYLEGRLLARQIRELVDSGETILDQGQLRPIGYGDIAILLRSPGGAGASFVRALTESDIPVMANQGGGFFDSPEIQIILSLLSVIDNPHRDIPLAAVLSSPVFGFSADALAAIRGFDREGDFYEALCAAAETEPACAGFLAQLTGLRRLSQDVSVYELISLIYERLELPALCSALTGSCGGRLMHLLDAAADFEENGYRGLFDFLRQLERMKERGEEPSSGESSGGSGVRLMSIHKSKGLEFPVVFLADTAHEFNKNDLRAPVLIHPELGLGCKRTDLSRGLEYPTLARRAIASRLSAELLSEEMRVLYVALTRAKERLYLSCTSKDPAELFNKLSKNLSAPMSPQILSAMPSMAQWLLSAALLENGGLLCLQVAAAQQGAVPAPETDAFAWTPAIDPAERLDLDRRLSFRYPHAQAAFLPSKLTATALPQPHSDEDGQTLVPPSAPHLFRLPDFLAEERPLTGAEAGSAAHVVLQFIDYGKTASLPEIEDEIARIRALGQLTERQAKAVDPRTILGFFQSPTGQRIRAAKRVYREQRFSILCPGSRFFPEGGEEPILLQGVVDCCFEEGGQLIILDYKTDFVTEASLAEKAERYKAQLLAYAFAMEKMLGLPVSSCILYFLRAGLSLELSPGQEPNLIP